MITPQPSCADIFESGLTPVEQALKQIISALPQIDSYEIINLEEAKGRTLFQNICASFNVPGHDNSAVDGYGIILGDSTLAESNTYSIIGSAFAGKPYAGGKIKADECVRIMTGAIIPADIDTIIMQEQAEVENGDMTIDHTHKPGQNIRRAGEDIKEGEIILQPGRLLTPADIGLIASLGICEIKVKAKLKIAIASTGNEVVNIASNYSTNHIYDSNRYTLNAALKRPDIEIINLGILEDKPEALLHSFQQASQHADMIISSGGVSVGDADHTKTALRRSGQVDFWKIAIKPGRPLAFGHIEDSVFFGLPGNPVAVMVTFYQFVLPAIEYMLDIKHKPLVPLIQATASENIRKKPGRTEVIRAILQQDANEWIVKSTGKQGSGILRSMSLANAFIILEHDRQSVKAGETVTVQPFAGLI